MKTPFPSLVLVISLGLCGCDGKKETAEATEAASPTPAPTPEPGYAGVASASPQASEEPVQGEVETPEEISTDITNAENALIKAEVLKRIDVMPNLKDEDKDKLYVQVDRARGMGKIITIPFGSGRTTIGAKQAEELHDTIKIPVISKYVQDPTVVFVVLGYADKKGDEKANLALSIERAESTEKVLKDKVGLVNLIHSVGMGGSELMDTKDPDKNRVVEVWAVLP